MIMQYCLKNSLLAHLTTTFDVAVHLLRAAEGASTAEQSGTVFAVVLVSWLHAVQVCPSLAEEFMPGIEERLARLEAVQEIMRLKAIYCRYADADYDAEGIASLFVQDGIWDGGEEFGRHVCRNAIKAFIDRTRGQIRFAAHLVMNPLIEVQDDAHATGKWRLFMPCTAAMETGREARWLLCDYAETYLRLDGRWLFSTIDMKVNFYAPHLTGWAE
jgi:hypothetical protein